MKYFISYTLRDGELTHVFLKKVLEYYSNNNETFLDILCNDSIDKQKRVLNELDTSDKLILIETIGVYESDWVRFEIERAKKNNINIERIKLEELRLKIKTIANNGYK